MDIYILQCTQITLGSGIEGFSVESKFFTVLKDATDEAYRMADKHYQYLKLHIDTLRDSDTSDLYRASIIDSDMNHYHNGMLLYEKSGHYRWHDQSHSWPEFIITVNKNSIDLTKKTIMQTHIEHDNL